MVTFPVHIHTKLYSPNQHIHVYEPEVYGLSNQTVQHQINRKIQTTLSHLLRDQGLGQPGLQEMVGNFEIKTNERNILSLVLGVYSFTGGAHGNTVIRPLTFDTTTGRQYQLKDLFKPNSDYVAKISDMIRLQIKERDLPVFEPFKSIKPDQDFYIADKSLVIMFPLYELLPYVYGIPYFPISVYSLRDIVNEEGPLGRMMG
ncbi:protein of unknown function [Thermoactinomyces sp. DSM 45891]|uniref:DUF3298 and DUF4163 domain-containing protein n=1 Tax=Thermoactinomyces sp. DSM 45891 TaxID=1761907 RepID=UPI00091BE47A|nr:DUF3298 and DUF4163 domain-containing protein [Thermoactinomyces sp. DSM 45891]SFX00704.1 protein of unknown function [Thermoactinomyces sp. DSM 45891]